VKEKNGDCGCAAGAEPPILRFRQAWRAEVEEAFRPGIVRLGRERDSLQVDAILEDDSPVNRATADHQRLHQLGDVFEIFLQGPGRADYHEFHLAPNGFIWQLHFPEEGYLKNHPEASLEDLVVREPLFSHRVAAVEGGWRIWATVPLGRLWGENFRDAGTEAKISFGRYDYTGAKGEPVISSTSPHQQPYFHRLHEWTPIRIA